MNNQATNMAAFSSSALPAHILRHLAQSPPTTAPRRDARAARAARTRRAIYTSDGMDPVRQHDRDDNEVDLLGARDGASEDGGAYSPGEALSEVELTAVERPAEGENSRDTDACRAIWDEPTRQMGTGETWILARVQGIAVGAGRLIHEVPNVRIDKVVVGEEGRGLGVGKKIVSRLMVHGSPAEGAIYTQATRSETGFYSILGFEKQGTQKFDEDAHHWVNTMVYQFPASSVPQGCTGLSHITMTVADIERSLAFYGCIGFILIEKFISQGGARGCYVEGMGTRLEFVEDVESVTPTKQNYGPKRCGFDRLVFDVTRATTDLETYLKHLSKRSGGWLEQNSPPMQEVVGRHVVSTAALEDPDGIQIEFLRRETTVPMEFVAPIEW